uniref:Proline dehydrogenase n=1 Tax=Phallusia mammillata TaxID=59560 RepID=A0A6F9DQB4_9ASCI|nr:probable proline dehydrogenase 2 [Phallusia mammillata]
MHRTVFNHGIKLLKPTQRCIPVAVLPTRQSLLLYISNHSLQNRNVSIKTELSGTNVAQPKDANNVAHKQEAPWDIDFTNIVEAYKSKSNYEIFRAAMVFQLCTIGFLVEHGMTISKYMKKVTGKWLFKKSMNMSFYGHFVAGENQDEIRGVVDKLSAHGVGAILDYAVEEDLSEEKAEKLEMDSCKSNVTPEYETMDRYQPHREFSDRRKKVVSARTYFYEGEAKCDDNMNIFLKCIDAVGATTDGGFAAVKLTALGRPQFLLQFSEVLSKGQKLFERFCGKEGNLVDRKFDQLRFETKAAKLGILMSRDESQKWFTWMDRDDSGYVDLLDWNEMIAKHRKFSDLFVVLNPETGDEESLLPKFTDEEEAQMKRMLIRVDALAQRALEKNVRLMIDAEQTYFQPAISRIVMEMMRKFNRKKTVIMNTYQCYLKSAEDNLCTDLALSQREGFHFGLKLVRGAYMEHERERAKQLSYDDPIQPSYEDTNRNYNKLLKIMLEHIKQGGKADVMFASHNEDSVKYALSTIHDLELTPQMQHQVYFGQLLGMCDHITFPLGQAGHRVFKYVPFGPVDEVLPYLHRRAQENRSVLSGSSLERSMLWRELRRRLFKGQIFYKPT